MFLNYFTLDQYAADADRRMTYLFRHTSSELLEKRKGSVLENVFSFSSPFSLHLIFDDEIDDTLFIKLLERIYLVIGRENYQTSLGRKMLFVSYRKTETKTAIKFISQLTSLLTSKVYISQVPYSASGNFASSLNVSMENNEADIENHFKKFLARMLQQKTLIDQTHFYSIITGSSINYEHLNKLVVEQLQNIPDFLTILNEGSRHFGVLYEELNHAQKEKKSLLNAISFLKKEVTSYFNEKEHARRVAEELSGGIQQIRRVEEINKKYHLEYENLPGWYKKVGALIKIIFGKVGFGYFFNKRQKQDFIDLLRTLPQDKQMQIWHYYEYEILPGWYKKLGNRLRKTYR